MKSLKYLLSILFALTLFASGAFAEEASTPSTTTTTKKYSAPVSSASPVTASSTVTSPSQKETKAKEAVKSSKKEEAGGIEELKLPEKEQKEPQYTLSGYYRVRALGLWDLNMRTTNVSLMEKKDLDHIGSKDVRIFYHKLRLQPKLKLNKYVTFNFQIDVFNDKPLGLPSGTVLAMDTSDKTPNIILKRAWGVVLLPIGIIEFGRVPSNFGFGISDNDGNAPDELFGDAHDGDTFDRILFATKPLGPESDLAVALVGDKVIESVKKFANLVPGTESSCEDVICIGDGDVNQFSFALLYNMGSGESDNPDYQGPIVVGNNLSRRLQDSTCTKAWSNDFYFKINLGLLYTGYEYVKLVGETKALGVLTQDDKGNFKIKYPKTTVDSAEWIWNIGLNTDQYKFHFELGSATGDVLGSPINGTTDTKFTQASFHPDYNVGLLMFEYGLDYFMRDYALAMKNNILTLVNNGILPQNIANQVLANLELLNTNGAVTNAFYVNPRFTYKLLEDKMKVTLAYLYAKANSPRVVSGKELKNYGHEIDLGIKYNYKKNVLFGLEGGIFFPGDYFDSAPTLIEGAIGKPSTMYGLLAKITYLFGNYEIGEEY